MIIIDSIYTKYRMEKVIVNQEFLMKTILGIQGPYSEPLSMDIISILQAYYTEVMMNESFNYSQETCIEIMEHYEENKELLEFTYKEVAKFVRKNLKTFDKARNELRLTPCPGVCKVPITCSHRLSGRFLRRSIGYGLQIIGSDAKIQDRINKKLSRNRSKKYQSNIILYLQANIESKTQD